MTDGSSCPSGGGQFSARASEEESILGGPRGPSGSRDGGIRVDFSHTALNTKAKKIHEGSLPPQAPHPHPLPDPLTLRCCYKVHFRSGQGFQL